MGEHRRHHDRDRALVLPQSHLGLATLRQVALQARGDAVLDHCLRLARDFRVVRFLLAAHEAHHITSRHEFQTLLVLFANFFTYGVMWVGKFTLFNRVLFANRDDESDLVTAAV